MKLILLTLLTLLSMTSAFSQHQDHPSVHGMVILGKEKVYLYHLPMFHNPHDYQVIIEATFDSKALEKYQASSGLMTLVPEKFSLPAMMKNPRPFKAQIYSGHFERGGELLTTTMVTIQKVLLFRKLNPVGPRDDEPHYYLFGNEKEQFVAHKISTRPDYDQLLKVNVNLETDIREIIIQEPVGEEIYFETGDLSH